VRRLYWIVGLAFAGIFLSLKDTDWTYDSRGHKMAILVLYGVVGALIGLCVSVVVEPAHSRRRRIARLFCWVAAFAMVGLALGHGNVPWLITLRFVGACMTVGAVIGSLQFIISGRTSGSVH
jgi:hypothetical protein